MGLDGIYISGFFSDEDKPYLDMYADSLRRRNIPFYVRNLKGAMLQSAFDFADFDVIAVGYTVLKEFLLNGGYDFTKLFLVRLWKFVTKDRERTHNIPFTVVIEGIPTENGPETIKCKIDGNLTDEQKDRVIEKAFALANKVENHQYQLLKNKYTFLEGHLLRYNQARESFEEIDIEEEIRKKTQEG